MMTITPATPEDAAAMAEILSDWIDATPWMPRIHTRDEDRWFCGHLIATQAVLVARDRAVRGFLARDGDDISALYLAADARGQGTGSRLLGAAQAGRDRLTLWTFAANTGALRFYARAGFRQTGATDGSGNDEGLPDVALAWTRAGSA